MHNHGVHGEHGADGRTVKRPDLARIITMTIPLGEDYHQTTPARRFEIAICANGSVESAARRATLFGRLLDENGQRLALGESRQRERSGDSATV